MPSIQNNNINSQLERLHRSDSNNNDRSDLVDSLVGFRDKINNIRDGLDVIRGRAGNDSITVEGDENGIYDINQVSGNDEALEIFTDSITSYSNVNSEYMELILTGSTDTARIIELYSQRETHKTNMQNMAESFNIDQDGTAEDLIKGALSDNIAIEASNSGLIPDLENQLFEFLALDTDLARASAADIRVQLGTAKEAMPEINNYVDNENDFLINLNKTNYRNEISGSSQAQLSQEYDNNFGTTVDLQNQASEFISLDTDLALVSRSDVQAELLISQSHLEVLHEDHNMNSFDTRIEGSKGEYFTELNGALRTDLENKMEEFLCLDTDLARASAADIRVQLGITDELIGFWGEQTEFWNGISGSTQKDENGVLTLESPTVGLEAFQISNDQEAQEYFDLNMGMYDDLNNQLNEFLSLDTDLVRAITADIRVQKAVTEGILLSIAENFNIDINTTEQENQSRSSIEQNNNLNNDLANQMEEFLQLDSDLARASAADIRVQMRIRNDIINNEQDNLGFYAELNSHDMNEIRIDDRPTEIEENDALAITEDIDNERITGTKNDDININGDENVIRGRAGNDSITVEGDENRIRGGRGDDYIVSNGDENRIRGGRGDDHLRIHGDENVVRGGSGDDYIEDFGESSNIRAGSGDDYISVSSGNGTRVKAGSGDDEIYVDSNTRGEVLINGGAGNDTVILEGSEEDYTVDPIDRTGMLIYTNNITGARITIDGNVEDVQFTNEEIDDPIPVPDPDPIIIPSDPALVDRYQNLGSEEQNIFNKYAGTYGDAFNLNAPHHGWTGPANSMEELNLTMLNMLENGQTAHAKTLVNILQDDSLSDLAELAMIDYVRADAVTEDSINKELETSELARFENPEFLDLFNKVNNIAVITFPENMDPNAGLRADLIMYYEEGGIDAAAIAVEQMEQMYGMGPQPESSNPKFAFNVLNELIATGADINSETFNDNYMTEDILGVQSNITNAGQDKFVEYVVARNDSFSNNWLTDEREAELGELFNADNLAANLSLDQIEEYHLISSEISLLEVEISRLNEELAGIDKATNPAEYTITTNTINGLEIQVSDLESNRSQVI